MFTAISRFKLRPGLSREALLADIEKSIPVYKGRPGLVRKYICLNVDEGWGCGVYLWETRELAEAFFAFARPIIREQTGADPEITILETPVVVDNLAGTVEISGKTDVQKKN